MVISAPTKVLSSIIPGLEATQRWKETSQTPLQGPPSAPTDPQWPSGLPAQLVAGRLWYRGRADSPEPRLVLDHGFMRTSRR
jgi:hypothetical protein